MRLLDAQEMRSVSRHEVEEQLRLIYDARETRERPAETDEEWEEQMLEEEDLVKQLNEALDLPVSRPTRTPLFQVELVHQNGQLLLEPSKAQLEGDACNSCGGL